MTLDTVAHASRAWCRARRSSSSPLGLGDPWSRAPASACTRPRGRRACQGRRHEGRRPGQAAPSGADGDSSMSTRPASRRSRAREPGAPRAGDRRHASGRPDDNLGLVDRMAAVRRRRRRPRSAPPHSTRELAARARPRPGPRAAQAAPRALPDLAPALDDGRPRHLSFGMLARIGWATLPEVEGGPTAQRGYPTLVGDEPWLADRRPRAPQLRAVSVQTRALSEAAGARPAGARSNASTASC